MPLLTVDTAITRNELRELARELLGDAIGGGRDYGTSWEDLDKYFYRFALVARAGR